jgi:hypothetical protein
MQDNTYPTQAEDPEDGSQDYISQQVFHTESSTFDSPDYNSLSDTTNPYPAEESEASADGLAPDAAPAEESEASDDELAPGAFPAEGFEASADELALDTCLAEESEADELALDMHRITSYKLRNRRRNRASEKAVSKAPRHNDGTRRRYCPKK